MRRTLLLLLSFLTCVAWGQTYRYRYWIDNNVGSAVSGSATGEKELTISLSSVGYGLHALHVQGRNSAGVWSSVRTRYFLKEKQDQTCTSARYWIDNDMTTVHDGVATSGVIELDIDGLSNGLHAVHYQKMGADGIPSAVRTRYFLKEEENQTCTSARYWIDNDMTTLHDNVATSGIIDIDITKLGVGLHAVHYQKMGTDGTPSAVRTRYFLVDRVQPGNFTASLSIDDGESTEYQLTGEDIVIEIGELAKGDHILHVTLTDDKGTNYGSKEHVFTVYKAEPQSLALNELPQMTYGDEAYELPQETAEGLALTWTSSDETVVTVVGNMLTVVGVGTATIIATQAGNETNLPFSREYELTVDKAMLTITADDCTKMEGDENPELQVSYSGFVNGDDESVLTRQPTVTTTATIDSPVGTYAVTVSGAEADNYEFTYVAGVLTVTERPVVLEATDISQLDNAIYVESLTAQIGSETSIDICLKNASAATAYVFDLVLPNGVTVAKNAKGKYMDELSDRHDDHTRTFNDKGNNVYSLSTLSGNSEELTGNDGAIRMVTLSVADDLAEGTYAIDIRNASYSKPDGTLVTLPDTRAIITVEDYVLGDVNSNGGVDIGDAVTIVNYLVGKESQNFVEKAADTNKNGQVDIGDAVTIVNYLVGKTASLSRSLRTVVTEREPQ